MGREARIYLIDPTPKLENLKKKMRKKDGSNNTDSMHGRGNQKVE